MEISKELLSEVMEREIGYFSDYKFIDGYIKGELMEVSKELLSEVLSYKLSYKIKVHKIIVRTGTLNYFYNSKDSCGGLFEANAYINISELVYKIEDWIESKDINVIRIKENKLYEFYINSYIDEETNETKIKGIIAVGEFILKEINGNK